MELSVHWAHNCCYQALLLFSLNEQLGLSVTDSGLLRKDFCTSNVTSMITVVTVTIVTTAIT